jgi:hypothetical protein
MHSRVAVAQEAIGAKDDWSAGRLGNIKRADF